MNHLSCESCVCLISTAELEHLEAQVRCRLIGRVHDIQLHGREKGLILRGRSPTYYAKQLAQHVLMEATALPIVANEIEVS
jgi:hypothetical protein